MAERSRGRIALRVTVLTYVGILVVVPLATVLWRTIGEGFGAFLDALTSGDAVHALVLTGIVAGSAVVLNTVFGVGIALLLARKRFAGRALLDTVLDLPVSVSPIVVGLALVLVYGTETGWFGGGLAHVGVQVIFATPGMILATAFVSLPLVVREVLPVLIEAGDDTEQAAACLGANGWQRFARITLPTIRWALGYGVVLSVARCLGEFGAVKVVSGDVSGQTQTLTVLIDDRAQQFEPGYYQLSVVLVLICVLCILAVAVLRPKEVA